MPSPRGHIQTPSGPTRIDTATLQPARGAVPVTTLYVQKVPSYIIFQLLSIQGIRCYEGMQCSGAAGQGAARRAGYAGQGGQMGGAGCF